MAMLSNLDLIRRVPLFSLLTTGSHVNDPGAAGGALRAVTVATKGAA